MSLNLYGYVQLMHSDGRPTPNVLDIKYRTVSIGSSAKCSITIKRDDVEPTHAKLTVEESNQVWLSKVGMGWETMKVNGAPLPTAKVRLHHKDTFTIGTRLFMFIVPNGDESTEKKKRGREKREGE